MDPDAAVDILLYTKDNCGLCEEMREQVEAFIKKYRELPLRLEIREIEDSAQWMADFREYVPTLVVHDQEVCHYFFDPQELTEALECPSHT